MTKLTEQHLPLSKSRGGPGFYHCKLCEEWVPWKDKHLKKCHGVKK